MHEYLKRAEAAKVGWPLPEGWDDARLEAALFPPSDSPPQPSNPEVPAGLRRHPRATAASSSRDLAVALGGISARPTRTAIGYSRFCELYQRWRKKLDVVLRQEHKAGEKAFVDWAGATMPIYDRDTGEVWQAPLFVAALGASSYTWAEATRDQQMESWLLAHVHALEHWGGVPSLVVPDNTKTGVTKACRYDPDLNPTYQNFAAHYGFGVLPARPYKPRDKANVENAVQVAQRWIMAALRHRKFFSLAEAEPGDRANCCTGSTTGRSASGTAAARRVFEALDKPALKPLPTESIRDQRMVAGARQHRLSRGLRRELLQRALQPGAGSRWRSARRRRPSRSCTRACAWRRMCAAAAGDKAVTNHEHRPKSHQAHLEWTPSRMVHWAQKIGPHTARLFERIMADKPHPEMGYRGCLGIIRLADKYSHGTHGSRGGARAADRRVPLSERRIDSEELARPAAPAGVAGRAIAAPPRHDNIRGAEYFE